MNKADSRARTIRTIALFLWSMSIIACASANKAALKEASAESAKSFAAGDYGRAFELHKKLYEKDRGDRKVVSAYVATIEEIKSAGDYARSQGSYTAAQAAYIILADNWNGFSALATMLTFKKRDLEGGLRDCRLSLCERRFRQDLEAGSYAKALSTYQAMLKEYPGDKTVKAGYAKGVAEIRAIGDKALTARDYALAGKVNGLLLKNLESSEELADAAAGGSSREKISEALRLCSSELTNSGLVEYRKGNLENAIAIWEVLLTFDPENAEIKKAVETAKAQLGKIKSSSWGGKRGGQSGRADR